MCLKASFSGSGEVTPAVQGTCASDDDDAFVFDEVNAQIQLKSAPTSCLVPDVEDTSDSGYGTGGFALKLGDCSSGVKWRSETNKLVVYPPPEDSWEDVASEFYKTSVMRSGRSFNSYMYKTEVSSDAGKYYDDWVGHSNSYTTFSFDESDGPITVTVEKLQGSYTDVVIRPLGSVSNVQKVSNTAVSFELSESYLKLSVEF